MSTMAAAPPPDPKPTKAPAKAKGAPVPPPTTYRLDWKTWQFGPVLGPLFAGGGLSALSMAGDLAGVSPQWGIAAGGAAGAAMVVRAVTRDISPVGLVGRAGCWLAAGGWMSWALASSAWSPNVLAALAAGTLGVGLAAPIAEDHEERVQAREEKGKSDAAAAEVEQAAADKRAEVARAWQDRLARVCQMPGCVVKELGYWDDKVGYTLDILLPPGGRDYTHVAKFVAGLAQDANLDHGCGVEALPGRSRGYMILKVQTVDTTAEAIPYPSDYSNLTINEPLPLGMHRGGVRMELDLLDNRLMIVGQIGSGKTVFLQSINADLLRCPDVIVWHIDLNGSGMSSPWLQPWLDGEIAEPPIDWVAATADEALRMVKTAIKMAKGRKTAYKPLMRQVNDNKVPVSPRVPAIVIVLDEGAEAVAMNRGNNELGVALESYVSTSRAARLGLILSGVRATADIIPPALQAQVSTKVAMRPTDGHEVMQHLGNVAYRMADEATLPGSGLIKQPGPGIRSFRGYNLLPDQIEDIARATLGRRPRLDEPTAKFGGDDYLKRWDRYRSWAIDQGETNVPAPRTPDDNSSPVPPQSGGGQDFNFAEGAARLNDINETLRKRREEAEAARRGEAPKAEPPAADVDAAFDALVSGMDVPVTDVDEITRIVAAAKTEGVGATKILAELKTVGIDISRATLYRRLDAMQHVYQPRDGVYAITPDAS